MNDLKVDANNNITVITPDNGEYYERAELQAHCVGGVKLYPTADAYIICNSDGDELCLPYNGVATCWLDDAKHNANARGTALKVQKEHIDLTKLFDKVEVVTKK